MKSDTTARIWAAIGTAAVAALAFLGLTFSYLSAGASDKKLSPKADITMEEEFIDVLESSTFESSDDNREAASHLEETVETPAQPTPAAGTDLVDKGEKSVPPQEVTAPEESPVKVKKDKQPKPGPAVDEKKLAEERARRKANDEVANAFKNAKGKHNAHTSDSKDSDKSGRKDNNPGAQGTTGTGSGKVGGGWIIPKYAPVPSTVTGSVTLTVNIDAAGKVTAVTFTGGTPPAATHPALRSAIEREVRARKFSRASYDDARPATAYITYTFK